MAIKRILALISVFAFAWVTAFAQVDFDVVHDREDNTVYVSGKLSKGTDRLIILKVEKDNAYFYMDDYYTAINRNFKFTFPFADSEAGYYNFKITSKDGSSLTRLIYLATAEVIEGIINSLNSADSWEDIRSVFETGKAAEILALESTLYNEVRNREAMYRKVYNTKEIIPFNADDLSVLQEIFHKYLVLAKINESENPKDIILSGELSDIFSDIRYTYENLMEDSARELIYPILVNKEFMEFSELKASFEELVILKALEKAPWQRFSIIFEKNISKLSELNITDYSNLNDKSAVAVKFANVEYQTIKDFSADFNKYIAVQKQKEIDDKNKSGSGGGGGSITSNGKGSVILSDHPLTPVADNSDIYASFNDIEGVSWAVASISYLKDKGIIAGRGEGVFAPYDPVTREEFVKLIVLAADMYNGDGKTDFNDIPAGHWSESYIASASSEGVVAGISETEFGLGMNIKRQDMCVLLFRIMEQELETTDIELPFSDRSEISEYAQTAVSALYKAGIINGMGDGRFSPNGTLTRAEAAKVIYELVVWRG